VLTVSKICFYFSRDLETYSDSHLSGCNLVDPDLNGGELNIKIPSKFPFLWVIFIYLNQKMNLFLYKPLGEAYQLGLVAEGKPIKVAVEFSLEDPRGGIHFVVPDGKIKSSLLLFCFHKFHQKNYAFETDVVNTSNVEYEDGTTLTIAQTLADRGAHIFTCGYENSSRYITSCHETFSIYRLNFF